MTRPTHRLAAPLLALAALSGCVPVAPTTLPPSGPEALTLAADPRVTEGRAPAAAGRAQHFGLPQIIALALRQNPRTRAAFARSEEAAAAAGLVDASYLPRISAEILAGANHGSSAAAQDPLGILPAGSVSTRTGVGAAVISVQWLLFDFGVRDATRQAAGELSFAANAGFTGVHQLLVHEVTQAYYALQAASAREALQTRKLAAAEEIAAMVRARRSQQLATITDEAQAGQLVAQARFDLVRARSEASVASTRLATLAGLPPGTRISTDPGAALNLPAVPPARLDAWLTGALQRRPDLQAAFARARASEANVRAVEASFRPKIVASAALGQTLLGGSVRDNRLGGVSGSTERSIAGVFVGVSIPLWDGGARQARLGMAEAGRTAARAEAEQLRQMAEGEIIAAYETLKAALAASRAAAELVATARTTYDAARSMSGQGLATVAEVEVALRMLYDAEIARIEAQHGARAAAATLAFSGGQIGAGL